MNTIKSTSVRSKQTGVGLIEVLIAVLVLSIGLLGIAALQAQALKNSQSSLERSNAVMLSYFILDAMRVNRAAALAGDYDGTITATNTINGSTLADNDLLEFQRAMISQLGSSASVTITCGTTAPTATVTITWDDSRGTAGNASQSMTTSTRL